MSPWSNSSSLEQIEELIGALYHVIDLHYMTWLLWVSYPLILTFILPALILILLYFCGLFLHIYRLRHILQDVYTQDFWNAARHSLCAFWAAQGNLWHGHEIQGFDHIPDYGPALIVYYHGAIPIDAYYLIAKTMIFKNRRIRGIGDRFLFHIPGFKLLLEVFGIQPGTVTTGISLMKEGHLLLVSPGGVREAFFSDEHYQLIWGKRRGFAKIAQEAGVPVIPMFTQNCREAFRSLSLFKGIFKFIYEKTRLPLVPIYGGFPVKLRTFLGEPIKYDPNRTPEELVLKVHTAIETLIKKHQRVPGNILQSLFDRLPERIRPKTS